MSSANQNNSFLRTVTSLTLLGGIAASFAWACVSSSDNKAAGGAAGDTGGSSGSDVGGNGGVSPGGSNSGGGAKGTGGAASTTACPTPDGGVATGPICTANPGVFETYANANGTFGTGVAGEIWGGAGAPWTAGTASALTSDMTAGNMHVTGSVAAGTGTGSMFGFNVYFQQTTDADAGKVGCWIVDAHQYSGMTIDISATALPNSHLGFGVNLANGNGAETTLTITVDSAVHTYQIPWGTLKLKTPCESLNAATITGVYAFSDWYGDTLTHNIDITVDNWGFY